MLSAVACIVGNIAYCLSYDAKSLALLVIARLVTGFGNPRFPFHKARCSLRAHIRVALSFESQDESEVMLRAACKFP